MIVNGRWFHPTKGFKGATESKIRRKIARKSRQRNRKNAK